ncbi:uncharacterized protein ACLA_071650 [Aspergillus clavatus NRRL 1]|uniref:SNF2 N-terminal domain-containing protein n=1 Tax=Aspergillus clavatus (strain ATCC 1007 / CBS 513.65 / DSM 816 / NCTC 3887 / NRRL 1 / QM 1276 / 107) TaxID=344612 RepID=A1C6W1_ASPCL|nr:uncharacterized protein ACLA_071650 [Aspergillus clavatus NRRL 1]EAW14132.1 hypothetical protein ACLA_071650 [Aspergillus clavatus NRRL 1]
MSSRESNPNVAVVAGPTLILCPSGLIDTWLAEIYARFGDAITVLLFDGHTAHTGDFRRKGLTINTTADQTNHDLKATKETAAWKSAICLPEHQWP